MTETDEAGYCLNCFLFLIIQFHEYLNDKQPQNKYQFVKLGHFNVLYNKIVLLMAADM